MSTTRKPGRLSAFLRNHAKRDETGAGGLLPIITVGMIVVIVAASIAASTTFAAKISNQQVAQMDRELESSSLLASFATAVQSNAVIAPEATVDGAGNYRVFSSAADTAPTSSTETGVTPLGTAGVPLDAKWLLVELTPDSGAIQTAVYAFTPRGSQTLDDLISWKGSASISESELGVAPGAIGPLSAIFSETVADDGQSLAISQSTVAADVYADYSEPPVTVSASTLRGILSSQSELKLESDPELFGDVHSEDLISGTAEFGGAQKPNDALRPQPNPQLADSLFLPGQMVNLTAEDCSTAERLKTAIESIDRETTLLGGDLCAPESWKIDVKPQASIIVHSELPLSIAELKVGGSQGSLGFSSAESLLLDRVSYSDGARGQFISGGDLGISESQLSGAIRSYGTAGGLLDIASSKIFYSPVGAPISGSCGGASCGLESNSVHLLRVR